MKMMDHLSDKIFATFSGGGDLHPLLQRLLAAQKNDWAELRKNYEQLEKRQTRALTGSGAGRLVLQCNPARAGSTLAKVDSRSIKERQCFLCLDNLPAAQKGILYRDNYLILCNPYPIFDRHFTVSSIVHRPQEIAPALPDLLNLVADMGPENTVFYNGPRCGASAPDHLHFQACPCGALPIESETVEHNPPVLKTDDWEIRVADITGRGMILVKAKDAAPTTEALVKVIAALGPGGTPEIEPLLNIIARKKNGVFRIAVFPRRKFRPDCFYREGDERIAVSPAAVELGGLIVTPFPKDFELLDFEAAVSILKEVSLDGASIVKLLSKAAL